MFFPTKIYNSDKFRHYLRFFTQVIYPIVVIIIPLFIGLCVGIAKNTKRIFKALRKDKFVKILLFIADESAEFIEDTANDYKYTKIAFEFLDEKFDQLGDIIEELAKWLRMEVLLIFMQIEYFNHCYISVMKTIIRIFQHSGRFLKLHGFSWLVNPIAKGAKRLNKVVDMNSIQNIKDNTERLQNEISNIKEKAT